MQCVATVLALSHNIIQKNAFFITMQCHYIMQPADRTSYAGCIATPLVCFLPRNKVWRVVVVLIEHIHIICI